MKKQVAVVKQDEQKPVERGVLAQAIVNISSAMNKLLASGLNRDAVIILTAHTVKPVNRFGAKPGMADIRAVFNALAELEREYCK